MMTENNNVVSGSLGTRLEQLTILEGGIKAVAKKANLNPHAIERVIMEDVGVNSNTLTKLLNSFPNLNPSWLLLGRGPMWLDKREEQEELETILEIEPFMRLNKNTLLESLSKLLSEKSKHLASQLMTVEKLKAELKTLRYLKRYMTHIDDIEKKGGRQIPS